MAFSETVPNNVLSQIASSEVHCKLILTYLVNWFVTYLVNWFVTYLVNWFVTYLVNWFVTYLVNWFVTYLVNWFVTYLVKTCMAVFSSMDVHISSMR